MALDDILKSLETEADEQSADILARAESQATRIIAEAQEDSQKIISASKETGAENLRSQEAKILLEARFKARLKIAEAKEELIDEVFARVEELIVSFPDRPDYEDVFKHLALEAFQGSNLDGHESTVKVNSRDVGLAESFVAGKNMSGKNLGPIRISDSDEINSGVAIVADGGRRTGLNTLESRLTKAKQLLRPSVGATLFNDNS
ncbi:MAG TPA: hypothetical protein ENI11_05205 [Actinobacteria bacterium]|nr:hypothetical protein [Actinomycetota bacterium]